MKWLTEFPKSFAAWIFNGSEASGSELRRTLPRALQTLPPVVRFAAALQTVERHNQIADLHGIDVYVYGVHDASKDVAYWQSISCFWTQYFAKSRGTLKTFSMMRDVANLGGAR